MNVVCGLPEQVPEQYPVKRRSYTGLLTILLASLLIISLILVIPLLTRSQIQRLASSDWSGYSVASDLTIPQPQVTSISATWVVPTVNVSFIDSFVATWIGIGGQFDDTLIQTGTEQDSINGQATYSAWYELLPYEAVTIDSLSVSAEDVMAASISLLDSTSNIWSIQISDVTDGLSFQKNLTYYSSKLSAEWIVERPTVNNRIGTLADFGQVTFTECTATIGNKVGKISSFPLSQFTMYNRQNIELTTISPVASDGSSFTVNFVD